MITELKFVNISGTRLAFLGSQAVKINLACGISGNTIVPLAVNADGTLLISGPQSTD